jgi:protein arginine N-methyltransferase 3
MPQLDGKKSTSALSSPNAHMRDSDSDSSLSDPLDLTRDEGWEDVEPDEEKVVVVSLFDDKVFTDVKSMLEYCKHSFDFDFVKVRADLGVYVCLIHKSTRNDIGSKLMEFFSLDLDFLETVKFINYLRSEAKAGNTNPPISKAAFEDDRYMKPVLDDDALLYSFDDLEVDDTDVVGEDGKEAMMAGKIAELEEALEKTRTQFKEYKEEVQKSLFTQFENDLASFPWDLRDKESGGGGEGLKNDENDSSLSKGLNDVGIASSDDSKLGKGGEAEDVAKLYEDGYFLSYAWTGL